MNKKITAEQKAMDHEKSDFQKAVEWFCTLSYEETTAVCKEVNPNTPHAINDKDLVPIWKKYMVEKKDQDQEGGKG